MANYLERVASSAGRRAAIAKPPNSGPPVLPAGRDFSPAAEDPFASDQDQFLAPARAGEIASTPNLEIGEESKTTPSQDPKSMASAVPKPRPLQERLSNESPFTVSLPRTLRPITTGNVPSLVPSEPLRARSSKTVKSESRIEQEPVPIVRSTDSHVKEGEESVITEVRSTVADSTDEHQGPVPQTIATEIRPIPRVAQSDGLSRQTVAEPSPPPALPVQVPPAAGSTTRQEQARITIGSLEVLVNNHPKVAPARPAPPPSQTEGLNLEKRYLDRFRLRH